MNKGLEALKELLDLIDFENRHDSKSEKAFSNFEIIEKELKRLEELEKAFDSLSKENEKIMKELTKEIEKNRALEIIKELFDIKVVLIYPSGDYELDIYNKNSLILYTYAKLSKEEYDLLKEVLL